MTAQKGKDLLVKIAGGGGYTTVAGLRTRRLAFNAETVDITHAESANRWRELLDGAGIKRAWYRAAACPLLAQSRHSARRDLCRFRGKADMALVALHMSAFDPKRTSR